VSGGTIELMQIGLRMKLE